MLISPDHCTERDAPSKLRAIRAVARGEPTLHTEDTIKGYVSSVLGKLQVAVRTRAALGAVNHGLEFIPGRGGMSLQATMLIVEKTPNIV